MSARRPAARLALAAALGWATLALPLAGCGDAPGPGAPSPAPDGATAPLFEPEASDVLLLLSGREGGLLKPCGCSEPQRGGLSRRAALWEHVRATGKGAAALSIGDSLTPDDPDKKSGEPRQNALKAELLREALRTMGYAGSLLSAGDLSPFATALSQPYDAPESTPRPPLNVKLRTTGPLAASASVDPILRFRVGDLPVRAVSVVDPTVQPLLVDGWGVADIVVAPDAAVRALAKEPGLLVVAAHTSREDLGIVAGAAGERADVAVVVDVRGEAADGRPVRAKPLDRPFLVTFGGQGKEVGVLRLARKGPSWTASYDVVPLDPQYEQAPSALRAQVDDLFATYRRRVREEKLLAEFPTFADHGPTWAGSQACKACHEPVYDSWKITPHAHALRTLAEKDAAWDPECVRCHTIGWLRNADGTWSRTRSSFQTPDATPGLADVGCEACHGPGSDHVKEPDRKDLFGEVGAPGKMWRAPGRAGCRVCHDPDNSHGFDVEGAYEFRYLPQVDHRDVPRSRRTHPAGRPPAPASGRGAPR